MEQPVGAPHTKMLYSPPGWLHLIPGSLAGTSCGSHTSPVGEEEGFAAEVLAGKPWAAACQQQVAYPAPNVLLQSTEILGEVTHGPASTLSQLSPGLSLL